VEVNPKQGKMLNIGALINGRPFSENPLNTFYDFANSARLLCGHNILDHHLPIGKELSIGRCTIKEPSR